MTAILKKCWQMYIFVFEDLADQRLLSWPFIGKPFQVIGLLALYFIFVTKWGPKWMEKRQPFRLKTILIIYNSLQIAVCSYIFVQAIRYGWGWDYKWVCQPVDYSNSSKALREAKLTYLYFLTKVLDLLDTVFFVLRKKHKQVTFLHLYHHSGMVLLIGGAATYFPGGHCSFLGVINSFIHVLMYSYYLLTAVRPAMKNILWYKKFITQLQIFQFFCITVHTCTLLLPEECQFPRWPVAILVPQNLFLTVLFTDFYIKTYISKPQQKLQNITTVRDGEEREKMQNKDVSNSGNIVKSLLLPNNNIGKYDNKAFHKID